MCDHIALVEWIKAVDRQDAKWVAKSGIYTTALVRASLASQAKTIDFISEQFDVELRALVQKRAESANRPTALGEVVEMASERGQQREVCDGNFRQIAAPVPVS